MPANSSYGCLWNVFKSLWNPLFVCTAPSHAWKALVMKREEVSSSSPAATTATGREKLHPVRVLGPVTATGIFYGVAVRGSLRLSAAVPAPALSVRNPEIFLLQELHCTWGSSNGACSTHTFLLQMPSLWKGSACQRTSVGGNHRPVASCSYLEPYSF